MKSKIDAILGAICGDIVGSPYEFKGIDAEHFELFDPKCRYTDDTVLTIALADWLSNISNQNNGGPKDYLLQYTHRNPAIGFGPSFLRWAYNKDHQPYNSCGNGSAMRVSAVGCYADSVEHAMNLAQESALPTHNHPEGIKGAQATAVAIVLARQGKSKAEIKATLQELFDYDLGRSFQDLLNGDYTFNVLCQNTVPEALISFFYSDSFEDCLMKAAITNRDTDTAAAIAGSIAGAYYGIPDNLKEQTLQHLPQTFVEVIEKLEHAL